MLSLLSPAHELKTRISSDSKGMKVRFKEITWDKKEQKDIKTIAFLGPCAGNWGEEV